jgi:hypothetical protein
MGMCVDILYKIGERLNKFSLFLIMSKYFLNKLKKKTYFLKKPAPSLVKEKIPLSVKKDNLFVLFPHPTRGPFPCVQDCSP